MGFDDDNDGGMGDLAGQTADQVDAELKDAEAALLLRTASSLAQLRPQIADSDKTQFDVLIAAVQVATAQNENVAQLKSRLTALGKGSADLVKQVIALAARL